VGSWWNVETRATHASLLCPGLWAICGRPTFDRIGEEEIKRNNRDDQDNGARSRNDMKEGLPVDTHQARGGGDPRKRLTKCGGVQCRPDGKRNKIRALNGI